MRRLQRIIKNDGKTVIVAVDHGMGMEVNPALDETGEKLKAIVAGGADAVLTTFGIIKKYGHLLEGVGVILRADGGYSALPSTAGGYPRRMFTVKDALRLGADAVVCNGFPGTPDEQECMKNVASLVAEGQAWNMPVMGEMLPGGFGNDVPNTPENVRLAVRTGCEYGVDIIKTTYAGTQEEFGRIVAAAYQPVVVLGGASTRDMASLFDCLCSAMGAGAAGVAIGRNVWNHSRPDLVTAALCKIVHGGATAAEALKGL